jgi:hypothetical protein
MLEYFGSEDTYMKSYLKTQWFSILMSLVGLVLAIVYILVPFDLSTPEGIKEYIQNLYVSCMFMATAIGWSLISRVDYNKMCLTDLYKRVETIEQKAVTDIDTTPKANHFVVRRRLGPDKDVPYPNELKSPEQNLNTKLEDTNQRLAYFNASQKIFDRILGTDETVEVNASTLRKFAFQVIEEYKK